MKGGIIAAMAVSAIVMLVISVVAALLGFFCMTWGLALSGFMGGQEKAVNAAFTTFGLLAFIIGLFTLASSIVSVYFLTARRQWNAVGAVAISICVAGAVSVAGQGLALLISLIVAGQLKTI